MERNSEERAFREKSRVTEDMCWCEEGLGWISLPLAGQILPWISTDLYLNTQHRGDRKMSLRMVVSLRVEIQDSKELKETSRGGGEQSQRARCPPMHCGCSVL